VNGNLEVGSPTRHTMELFAWNGPDLRDANGSGFDMRRSQVEASLGVVFRLQIRSRRLTIFELVASGYVGATAATDFSASGVFTFEHVFNLVARRNLGTTKFLVGPVPVRVAAELDVDASLSGSLDGSATFSAGVSASAYFSGGVAYRDGGWQTIHNNAWSHSSQTPTVSASATGPISLAIVPTISLVVNWIGGPYMTIYPFLGVDLEANLTSCSAALGWGIEVSIGARIDIQNPANGQPIGCGLCRHELGEIVVFSTGTQPLMTCEPCSVCIPGLGGTWVDENGGCECEDDPVCRWLSDGECDDGGSGSEYSLCPLGTDCSDCGSRCAPPPPPPPPL